MAAIFFEEQSEQSRVKALIVSKYFKAWANVIVSAQKQYNGEDRIAYIDLFAGPGRYRNGAKSTPVMVLELAIADPRLRDRLVTIFNDSDKDHADSLQDVINEIPGLSTLKHKPVVDSEAVTEEAAKDLNSRRLVPTLFFVDPWGYKGLSLSLIKSVLKDWGCDCIFFFNYNRINMGVSNELVRKHMEGLFGPDRAASLAASCSGLGPADRELTIVNGIADALREMGGEYVLPFRFRDERGTRTSHHLIFTSKHFKGYEIMKHIMASESSTEEEGVPSLEYSPADHRFPLLFALSRPLEDLGEMLLAKFAGRTLTMREIYVEHNVGTRFISKNYKDVLNRLERCGKITANPAAASRKKNKNSEGGVSFADSVWVSFPTG